MDENRQFRRMSAWALGVTGVGGVLAAIGIPGNTLEKFGGAAIIVLLALLLFGGYILLRSIRARRQRERFSSALEAQTAAAPKSISDPNQRAALDQVRQKFQKGLQEFKSRGKDIYKMPWYVIIGESGSGKTEAIRHSGIKFPSHMQDNALLGSGGTVNMDWWFTNDAIILDTAGTMIFNQAKAGEAPEWREFLRLLKRARPHCPVNGLFLVLSVESFIRDSADSIGEKASRLAQQLDLIQRTLDVRFPVYLLVTKCDLLIGFREFFDSIDDPGLQHQMFGWSKPEPLDAHFRPDLVEQHLKSVAERLRRRRMALLRASSGGTSRSGDTQQFFAASYQLGRGPAGTRRLDEVDSLFALPESVMRLAPRLRRYLETVFVAGEWSAKPVFLRGIYFTSSMREGKALDEAIAFATGLPLDKLPEDRSWDKNKAFFLRDLFVEKVFRESGLVTRATNTLKLLRQRQFAIFGSAAVALLLLLVFAWVAKSRLDTSVGKEAHLWKAGAVDWKEGVWVNGSIVTNKVPLKFAYAGANKVKGTESTAAGFQQQLRDLTAKNLSGGWFFRPVAMLGPNIDKARREAARLLFETGVLRPLVYYTRDKMLHVPPSPEINRHSEAWWSLLQIEADSLAPNSTAAVISKQKNATDHLGNLLCYLTEEQSSKLDTNLVGVFLRSFASKEGDGKVQWPPVSLLAGNTLATNNAIRKGLENYNTACVRAQTNINLELTRLNGLTDQLAKYYKLELEFLESPESSCDKVEPMRESKEAADRLQMAPNLVSGSLKSRYSDLGARAAAASASSLSNLVSITKLGLDQENKQSPLVNDIGPRLSELEKEAGKSVLSALDLRAQSVSDLDTYCLSIIPPNNVLAYQARWELYTNACAMQKISVEATIQDIGDSWRQYTTLKTRSEKFLGGLAAYKGPLEKKATNKCSLIAQNRMAELEKDFLKSYKEVVWKQLQDVSTSTSWTTDSVTNVLFWFSKVQRDWNVRKDYLGANAEIVIPIREDLTNSRQQVLKSINKSITDGLKFPVFLDADPMKPMDLENLRRLRPLVAELKTVLQDPGWETDSPDQLRSLQEDLRSYSRIVTSLTKPSGAAAEWKLFFVPPKPEQKADEGIRKYFRQALISPGPHPPDWKELPNFKARGEVGKGSLDSAVKLTFRRNAESPEEKPVDYPVWGILQWIRNGKPERLEDGRKWRFRVGLRGQRQNESVAGDLFFEVEFLDEPLPELKDWPHLK